MACLKGVTRPAAALVALAPDAPYMATGKVAGAVDQCFSSSASLEIFGLNFESDDQEFPLAGEAPSSERFNRLSWGRPAAGSASEEFSLGLVAGGHANGTIDIWNPLALIR
jgi:protein transport protein SEC31